MWQREQERDSELYDEYVHDAIQSARSDLQQILMVIDRIPKYEGHIKSDTLDKALNDEKVIAQEYLKTIREILDGNQSEIILHAILQPLSNALIECEFNLEALEIQLGQKPQEPTANPTPQGES